MGLTLLNGTGLDAALGQPIIPLIAICTRGRAVVPQCLVLVLWAALLRTYALLIELFTGVVCWCLVRSGISGALQLGFA